MVLCAAKPVSVLRPVVHSPALLESEQIYPPPALRPPLPTLRRANGVSGAAAWPLGEPGGGGCSATAPQTVGRRRPPPRKAGEEKNGAISASRTRSRAASRHPAVPARPPET